MYHTQTKELLNLGVFKFQTETTPKSLQVSHIQKVDFHIGEGKDLNMMGIR